AIAREKLDDSRRSGGLDGVSNPPTVEVRHQPRQQLQPELPADHRRDSKDSFAVGRQTLHAAANRRTNAFWDLCRQAERGLVQAARGEGSILLQETDEFGQIEGIALRLVPDRVDQRRRWDDSDPLGEKAADVVRPEAVERDLVVELHLRELAK